MSASTIGAINLLPDAEKRAIYAKYIPEVLLHYLGLPSTDSSDLLAHLKFVFPTGSSNVELALHHRPDFPDPVLYTHLTDTMNGQIHVLLYILNDPSSPRFDVDRMPDGSLTRFGTVQRNIEAEHGALQAGLAPGQVRRGLRMLGPAIASFEEFVRTLGQNLYFVEPLHYHNAVIFERYGFAYQMGRRRMDEIHAAFGGAGKLPSLLSAGSGFRQRGAASSIRLRSWAIHDGILGESYTGITMYKRVGVPAGIDTAPGVLW
jgi:hypothetical protein